jgi:hypothetical protein
MYKREQYVITRHENGWHTEVTSFDETGQRVQFNSSSVHEDEKDNVGKFSKTKSLINALSTLFSGYLRSNILGGLCLTLNRKSKKD